MKRAILTLLIIAAGLTGTAQNAKVDGKGNFVAIKHDANSEPGKATGKTFTDAKGTVYPVLESKKGKLYYMRTSKNGNVYKFYIKTEPAA